MGEEVLTHYRPREETRDRMCVRVLGRRRAPVRKMCLWFVSVCTFTVLYSIATISVENVIGQSSVCFYSRAFPTLSALLTSAPLARRSRTTSTCPLVAALIRAVCPSWETPPPTPFHPNPNIKQEHKPKFKGWVSSCKVQLHDFARTSTLLDFRSQLSICLRKERNFVKRICSLLRVCVRACFLFPTLSSISILTSAPSLNSIRMTSTWPPADATERAKPPS